MKLPTLGYVLVGLLAGTVLVWTLSLVLLTYKFNNTLRTLDSAYFEQVLPLRQIDANNNEIRYHLLAAAADGDGGARQAQPIQALMRKNQVLWTMLETAPQMEMAPLRSSYSRWLQTAVLPLLATAPASATTTTPDTAALLVAYRQFEQVMDQQIGIMRERGHARHAQMAAWQHLLIYLALALTLATTVYAAWLAQRTIAGHGRQLETVRQSLAEACVDVESRVAARTAALRKANSDMRRMLARLRSTQEQLLQNEKLAALGCLVAGLAHELNTPIGNGLLAATTLSGKLQDIQKALGGRMQRAFLTAQIETMATCCQLLERSLQRSASLVARFSEISVHRDGAPREQFELNRLLTEVRAARSAELRMAGCAFVMQVPEEVTLFSYPQSLARVLHNLIDNALLHAFDSQSGCRIDIMVRDSDRHCVYIAFRDNGLGMPVRVLERVFDPFFTTRMGQGSGGLGMTIVHNTVTAMLGGTISVSTGKPKGTIVDITLPRIAPERQPGPDDIQENGLGSFVS